MHTEKVFNNRLHVVGLYIPRHYTRPSWCVPVATASMLRIELEDLGPLLAKYQFTPGAGGMRADRTSAFVQEAIAVHGRQPCVVHDQYIMPRSDLTREEYLEGIAELPPVSTLQWPYPEEPIFLAGFHPEGMGHAWLQGTDWMFDNSPESPRRIGWWREARINVAIQMVP